MTFTQVLPTVSQLSHQDKLRLIHFLLEQLAATDAVVWSPQTDSQSIQALSNLLATAQEQANA